METKLCKKCGIEKNIDEYRKILKNNKCYYRNKCKTCECDENNQRAKEYYKKNKDELIKKNYERYKNNQNYIAKKKEYNKKYRETNKDKIKEDKRKWRENNKEKEKEYRKEYYYNHQEERKEKDKIYYQKNKDKILNKQREKCKKDKIFKMKKQIRTMIWASFSRKAYIKKAKCEKIIGCDLDCFCNYLLGTFITNYGYEWDKKEPVHIDHIIPLSTATNEEEITKLCHYSNLQLLKEEDNLHKSNKVNWELAL